MSEREEPLHGEGGLPEEEFSALLQSISTMAPLFKGVLGGGGGKGAEKGCSPREALLLALKPYLSPERCEMVDYLIRMGRLGDMIRALQQQ